MASKKALADAAYHKQEGQRALLLVLEAAEMYTKVLDHGDDDMNDLVTSIASVRAEFLTVTAPAPAQKTLAGQLDLDGSVEGAQEYDGPAVEIRGVPDNCPGCQRAMFVAFGGSWQTVVHAEGATHAVQCAGCAFVVPVSLSAWERVRELRRNTIGRADVKIEKVKAPKVRGAG